MQPSSCPLVSVILPIYNAERTICRALQSVIQQKVETYEILLIDDGSTDQSIEIALRHFPHCRVYRQNNKGPAAARNLGITLAHGTFLAFLDADDTWDENKLSFQLRFLQEYESFSVVTGWIQPSEQLPRFSPKFCAAFFRKQVFDAIGPLNEDLPFGEDLDWFIRAKQEKVSIAWLPRTVMYYHLHDTNMTRGKTAQELGTLSLIHNSLQKRKTPSIDSLSFVTLPFISIILPLYNGEKTIEETLQSALNQTYPHFEIIVVDDGSTDSSKKIVQSFPQVRYVYQENQGNAAARMKGVSLSQGELIAFLDQDDLFTEDKLLKQIGPFLSDPNAQCVTAKARYFKDPSSLPPPYLKEALFSQDSPSFVPGVLVVKKQLLVDFPFNVSYLRGSDTDFFFRLKESKIPIIQLDVVVLKIRMHAHNLSHSVAYYNDLLRIIKSATSRNKLTHRNVCTKTLNSHAVLPTNESPSVVQTLFSSDGNIADNMGISVIIPVYNGELYLAEAIESVLRQKYVLELLIVDDGSIDQTREIALSYGSKVVYIPQNHQGISAARNLGIHHAKGTLIAFLDADDVWEQGKLSSQLSLFIKDPYLEIASCFIEEFSDQGLPTRGVFRGPVAGSILVKKNTLQKVGPFMTHHILGEFIDWFARAQALSCKISFVPHPYLKRRVHSKNTTRQHDAKEYLSFLKDKLQREGKLSTHPMPNIPLTSSAPSQ